MPNWCSNILVVAGAGAARFAAEAGGGDPKEPLSLERLDPVPDGTDASTHWGTKWDIDFSAHPTWESGLLTYHFASAWSPPVEAIARIAAARRDLTFTLAWHEGGVYYSGLAIFTCPSTGGDEGDEEFAGGGGELTNYVVVQPDNTGWVMSPEHGSFTISTLADAAATLDELWDGENELSTYGLNNKAILIPANIGAADALRTWADALATGCDEHHRPVRTPPLSDVLETCLDNIGADPDDFADHGGDLIRDPEALNAATALGANRRRELIAFILANAWGDPTVLTSTDARLACLLDDATTSVASLSALSAAALTIGEVSGLPACELVAALLAAFTSTRTTAQPR